MLVLCYSITIAVTSQRDTVARVHTALFGQLLWLPVRNSVDVGGHRLRATWDIRRIVLKRRRFLGKMKTSVTYRVMLNIESTEQLN